MNTIERISIGAISAIISATLLFVETAPMHPLPQNSGSSYDHLAQQADQIASTKQSTRS